MLIERNKMIRRHLLALICLFLPFFAFAEEFTLGKDYEVFNTKASKPTSHKVSVTEFFSYGCPWCYKIEPSLTNWVKQKGNSIEFSRVPVVFNKDWLFYAKAYYTAKLLNLDSKFNNLLFQAIQNKNETLNSNATMIAFFTAQGVDKATAQSAFENSTTVEMRVNDGTAKMTRYHINGVPAIVVNHQYKTDLQMAKTEERFFKILDFLVQKSTKK